MALGQGQTLDGARRRLSSVAVPSGYEEMHRSIHRWLKALMQSCEVIFRSRPPLDADTLARARKGVYDAGVEADSFNRQRQAIVEALSGGGAAAAGARTRVQRIR